MSATGAPGSRPYRGAYMVGLLMIGVVGARAALWYPGRSLVAGLLLVAAFAALYLAEPRLGDRRGFRWLYYPAQTALLVGLAFVPPYLDMVAALYIPLAPQAARSLAPRPAAAWIALWIVALASPLVIDTGWAAGLALALTNCAGGAFLLSYDRLYRQTRAGQLQSQALLAELQQAHLQLRAYAGQAEELAAARERNRLARDLHDSVSQVMFSVTLTARAARRLLDLDPARAAEQIDRLQEMTAGALAQLRSLIAQLHPRPDSTSAAGPTTQDRLPPSAA